MLETLQVLKGRTLTGMSENQAVYVREGLLESEDVVEFIQEPLVNVGHLPDLINAVSPMECC